ncbi:hypothetical protein ACVWWI_006667 [Bradyrhizobium sp. USDA 3686]|nr:hypothetical protein [Bradyrhizobium canariense]
MRSIAMLSGLFLSQAWMNGHPTWPASAGRWNRCVSNSNVYPYLFTAIPPVSTEFSSRARLQTTRRQSLNQSGKVWALAARSAWQATASPHAVVHVLAEEQACDFAAIGAGYAGLNAGLRPSELGIAAVVVGAEHLGCGASAPNGGQVIPSLKMDRDSLRQLDGFPHPDALVRFAGRLTDRHVFIDGAIRAAVSRRPVAPAERAS